jgi:glycosyltransferase 2 family protein
LIESNRARLQLVLRGAVSLALIALVLRKVDWVAFVGILKRLDYHWALAGWSLGAFVVIGNAARWRLFLSKQGINIPFTTVLLLSWAGQFFNSMLPGSIGGDAVKIVQICRLVPERKAAAAATVFVDRFTAFVLLGVLAAGALVLDPTPLNILSAHFNAVSASTAWLVTALFVAALALWLILRRLRLTYWGGRAFRTMAAARDNLRFDGRLVAAVSLAIVNHLLTFFVAYSLAKALQVPITYLQVIVIGSAVACCIALPVTINGHGLREFLLVAYFTQVGLTSNAYEGNVVREVAIAWSLLIVINDLLWSIPGGIWYLARRSN